MPQTARGVAVALLLAVVVVPTVGVSLVADDYGSHTAAACSRQGIVAYEYAQEPAEQEFDSPRVGRYENLSEREQAIFDVARSSLGTEIETTERRFRRAQGMPEIVVRNDSVYGFRSWLDGCPRIAGLPASLNPVIAVYLRVSDLLTGPLAPLLVVAGGLGGAAWLGKRIEY